MTNSNNDERLAQLVTVAQLQQQNIGAISVDLADLKEIVRQQLETATRQQQSIERLASVFAEQAKTITELSKFARESVEAAREAARAAQAAAIVSQNNQNAIRDLIGELRQGR